MSTAGSTRNGEHSQYTPPTTGSGDAATPPKPTRTKIFRWQGIVPIVLLLAVLYLGWTLFGARVIRATIVEAGTKALGTQLDITSLDIRTFATTVDVKGIALADPFDVNRNLVEVGQFLVELEAKPLLQKKFVIKRLTIANVRTGTVRAVPARRLPPGTGFAPRALAEVKKFASQFKVPILSLVPIDSLKAIVLDPSQLKAVQSAIALGQNADSAKTRLTREYADLRLQETLDSSRATYARLQSANLRTLGIDGARTAVTDLRRAISRIDETRARVDRLVVQARQQVDTLQAGLLAIDVARREDYEHARNLLQLPSLETPDIGAALFGQVTIDKFQQAVYWATLARQYAPPGLLPREQEGPKRVRMAGTTISFVKPEALPQFLLRRADLSFEMPAAALGGNYRMAVQDLTSDPAILGRPTRFAARRDATGRDSVRVVGEMNHVGIKPTETLAAAASGISLPKLPIPSLPYTIDPGKGSSEMRFELDGEKLSGRWSVKSTNLAWVVDSSRARKLNKVEDLVARVLTGIPSLELTADVSGTLAAPKLAVKSNLDRQVGDRLRAVVGQEVAAAQAKVRAQVDRLVEEKTAPVKAKINEVRAEGEQRVADARARLDEERRRLEERVKALSGGLNLPKLPGT
jgi:uncharacterized protein (TIGR03545 family)